MTSTAVVTGGARGIGRAVAEQLLGHGLRVVVLARDPERGRAAVAQLGTRAELVVGDLSDVAGTRAAATALAAACPRIDVLVHNAALWPAERALNADGVERSFATNHLAPFLLNHLLHDTMRRGTRIVQVTAGLYGLGRAEPERTATGADFHRLRTYADTKLANLALVPLFARLYEPAGVAVNAVHPGVVRTGLGDRSGGAGLAVRAAKLLMIKAPAAGARPVVRLAVDPALEGTSGRYYEVDREKPLRGSAAAPEFAEQLWRQAAALTGVGAPVSGDR